MAQDNLQYGRRDGGSSFKVTYPVGASEVFKKAGGAFVGVDGSGRIEIATATTTAIIGWAVLNEDLTASTTEGGTILPVELNLDAIYEIKINTGTWTDNYRGETCDLSIVSNVQGAALGATSIKIIELISAGYTNSAGTVVSVLCKLNRLALTRAVAA